MGGAGNRQADQRPDVTRGRIEAYESPQFLVRNYVHVLPDPALFYAEYFGHCLNVNPLFVVLCLHCPPLCYPGRDTMPSPDLFQVGPQLMQISLAFHPDTLETSR